ncbi:MAG TPA: hypothetical protein VMI30_00055 [Stellaceae bacterium]|nr:hypothetical protein [Stellaceae bacterium]
MRLVHMIATTVLLTALPWDQAGRALVVIGVLPLVATVGIGNPASKPKADPGLVILGGDMPSLALLRRTEPALRMRRPAVTIDTQIRWRQAAEARRRRRDILP